ncbi:MAG: carbon-nitrogen hydrolase family protein [Candidatus Aminicenantes bacterium]|nr:carbon-nitrogen hydrolase family protein [Candidatus Aminicenantes bacterium]
MRIALIQQHCTQDVNDNQKRAIQSFKKAADKGAKLISYAELGFSYFLPQKPSRPKDTEKAEPIPGPTTDLFTELSKEYKVVTVLNLYERMGDRTYDSSPVIDTDGSILGTTRMAHIMDGMGFYEKGYYDPGNTEQFVYHSSLGKVGVAICYDRHFPEYMRNLALNEAEIVIVPQAGAVGEWAEGMFEAELRVAAFQNGYFVALTNRVGKEDTLDFAGESFVVNPEGNIIAQAPSGKDHILYAECDLSQVSDCTAKRFFLPDRRPDYYQRFKITEPMKNDK